MIPNPFELGFPGTHSGKKMSWKDLIRSVPITTDKAEGAQEWEMKEAKKVYQGKYHSGLVPLSPEEQLCREVSAWEHKGAGELTLLLLSTMIRRCLWGECKTPAVLAFPCAEAKWVPGV